MRKTQKQNTRSKYKPLITAFACHETPSAKEFELYTVIVPGDINASGTVNTADMRLLQRVLVGETELTDTAALAADLNENGRPDAADLVLLAAKMQRD